MSTHPSHRHTETYIVERHRVLKDSGIGHWLEAHRFSHYGDAVDYVRANTPAWSPWRIVRLRIESRSEVLDQQEAP